MRQNLWPILAVALLSGVVRADNGFGHTTAAPEPALAPGAQAPRSAVAQFTSLASLEQAEADARAKVEQVSSDAKACEERIRSRGHMLYRLTRPGLLAISGGFDGLVDHAMRVERVRRALSQDLALSENLVAQKAALLAELNEIAMRRAPLQIEQQAAEQARAALGEAEDRRLAFERAFQTSTGPSDYVAIYGGDVGPDTESRAGDGFRAMKGRLPFPLLGRAEIKNVRREGAGGPGVEMRAPVGTPVRAVYAGRVAFADEYGPYGKIIILDHGERYYTVMANLGSIDVRLGDDVSTGSTVGTVGDDGQGSMLYFEVRHGSTTLDPSPWLGL